MSVDALRALSGAAVAKATLAALRATNDPLDAVVADAVQGKPLPTDGLSPIARTVIAGTLHFESADGAFPIWGAAAAMTLRPTLVSITNRPEQAQARLPAAPLARLAGYTVWLPLRGDAESLLLATDAEMRARVRQQLFFRPKPEDLSIAGTPLPVADLLAAHEWHPPQGLLVELVAMEAADRAMGDVLHGFPEARVVVDEAALDALAVDDDPQRWLVWGDSLQSQGDPRGMLAQVQLQRETDPDNVLLLVTERALLGAFVNELLGPARDPFVVVRWRRGLWDFVSVGPGGLEVLLAHPSAPLLRTVRTHLSVLGALDRRNMRCLRRLEIVQLRRPDVMRLLRWPGLYRIQELAIDCKPDMQQALVATLREEAHVVRHLDRIEVNGRVVVV